MPILRHFFLVDFLVPRNYTDIITERAHDKTSNQVHTRRNDRGYQSDH